MAQQYMTRSQKALMLELKSLQEKPVEGFRITLVDESDLYAWEVAINVQPRLRTTGLPPSTSSPTWPQCEEEGPAEPAACVRSTWAWPTGRLGPGLGPGSTTATMAQQQMTRSQKALMLELKSLQEKPVEGFRITLVDESDLYAWEVAIFRPPTPSTKEATSRHILNFL
ncbi:Ubiquitin-conjugating enzyme E2 R2 [Myotis davidii]|uniref:Ubiquitin-conjugating enzyme E2 R2 n=1 Tax=Myotis davidii TaxID=225400 RepID=L5M1B0_MYODS|nr:Ubiquitin-conjugating enzyme E2 R2 [Myotis davidii]